jgi:hypothetical protein
MEVAAAGTTCISNPACGAPTCDGKGNCVGDPALVGKSCDKSTSIACAKYACNAAGQCALAPNPGAECLALADPLQLPCSAANHCSGGVCGKEIGKCELKGLTGKACPATGACTVGVCSAAGKCEQVPVAVGKSCASTSPCTVGACSAAGVCEQVPVTDGKSCALDAASDPQCASGACVAGKCEIVANTGKSCGKQQCKAGVCSTNGVCEFTPTPGASCGAESECSKLVCDAAGECKSVAKAGASCGAGPCQSGACSADGQCIQQVKVGAACQDPDLCGEGVCNVQGQCVSPQYQKKSECHVDTSSVLSECWAGVIDAFGKCTKVARVGASCGCWVSPCSIGTCQADGSCLQKPSKPAGTPCSSDCVADGVCTSAGKCSGTVAVGEWCSDGEAFKASYGCRNPRCQADGDCAQEFLPAGSYCGDAISVVQPDAQLKCGKLDKCDGQGHCIVKNPAKNGTACSLGDPCSQGRTCFEGHCLGHGNKPDKTPCAFGCLVGACNGGWCEKTGPASDISCDDGNLCTEDACCGTNLGSNCWIVAPGECMHKPGTFLCGDYECSYSACDPYIGQCVEYYKLYGTPCGADACGTPHTCQVGYCKPAFGSMLCNDGNPCTVDYCGSCGCTHTPDASAEGQTCAQGGHCLKGNCVPD